MRLFWIIVVVACGTSRMSAEDIDFKVDPQRFTLGVMVEPCQLGVTVLVADKRGPAYRAGIRDGFVISTVNGVSVKDEPSFQDAVAQSDSANDCVVVGYRLSQEATWKPVLVSTRQFVFDSLVDKVDQSTGLTTSRHNSSPAMNTDDTSMSVYLMHDKNRVLMRFRFAWSEVMPGNFNPTGFRFRTANRIISFPDFASDMLRSKVVKYSASGDSTIQVSADFETQDNQRHALLAVAESENPEMILRVSHRKAGGFEDGQSRSITPAEQHALRTVLQAYCLMRDERKSR